MKPSDLDKQLEIYYIDENTGKEYTFTEYLDSVIDSFKNIYLNDSRITILDIETPFNVKNYIYITIKFQPLDDRKPLYYVIYNDLFNKFRINRKMLKDEQKIDLFYRSWAETDNLYDWMFITSYNQKHNIKFPENNMADIIEMLYEHDIKALEKTIQEEENRTKYPTSKDDSDNFFKSSRRNSTPYERTKAEIYKRGNKWQIENWESTHD